MSYKKKTPFFGIPYPADGEIITSKSERKKALIIENQLRAATHGVRCCVIEEGGFDVFKDNETGLYEVLLGGTGPLPALMGIVNGCFVYRSSQCVWSGLKPGFEHHLYIQWNSKLPEDPSHFRELNARRPMDNKRGLVLYLAVLDLRNPDSVELDIYPDGKVYSNNMALHAGDWTNPHGVEQVQDYMTVRKGLRFDIDGEDENGPVVFISDRRGVGAPTIASDGELRFADERLQVLLSGDGDESLLTKNQTLVGAINELVVSKNALVEKSNQKGIAKCVVAIDTFTNGKDGTPVEVESKFEIMWCEVQRRAVNGQSVDGEAGEFIVGYSDDGVVDAAHKAIVYNTGGVGIPIRIVIFCR